MTSQSKQNLILVGILAVVVAINAVITYQITKPNKIASNPEFAGAAGNMLAEEYDPYVRYNNGYNSALAITTSDTVTGGDLAATDDLTVGDDFAVTGNFTLGTSGTAQTNQIVRTCSPTANTSIAATSTGYIQCTGLTGITSDDEVFASFATSTLAKTVLSNWVILATNASTTAGAVDILLLNLTGAAAVPSAVSQIASTTSIFAAH